MRPYTSVLASWVMAASAWGSTPPALSLEFVSAGIRISWPAISGDWVLEETPLSAPVVWKLVPATLHHTDAGGVSVEVGPPVGSRFYRLRELAHNDPPLTGYWNLDEALGGTASESTGLGHTLHVSNASWAAGYRGSALQFNGQGAEANGSRAWVSNVNHAVLSAAAFTISLRFNAAALTTGWRGLAGMTDGAGSWQLSLNTIGTGTNDLVFSAPALTLTGRALILPDQWYQATLTSDGEVVRLYLNGLLLAQGAGTVFAQDGPVYFGGGIGGHASFLGRLDDLRVYGAALTAEEVALAGHWRFNENGGQLAADAGPNSRSAILTDETAWVAGRTGTGIDSSRSVVEIRNDDRLVLPPTGAPFSLSLWVNPRSLSAPRTGLISCANGAASGWAFDLHSTSDQIEARWSSLEFGGTLDLRAPVELGVGRWSRIDLNFDGGLATVYVDGRSAGSASGGIRVGGAPMLLGRAPGATDFQGIIDELKVFNRARLPEEIGPGALVMWETVRINTETNFVLQGFGPPGKPLIYTIVDTVVPTNGVLTHVPGTAVVTYHAQERKGPDAFAYTVSDGEFTTPPTIVAVSVVRPLWLSPDGGPVEPRDGTSPERAWLAGPASALDGVLRTNNYYDCFYYAPGVYHTTGSGFDSRTTANPGCKHIGSGAEGPNATILRLVGANRSTGEGLIFGLRQFNIFCDGFEVHHMTLDCNAQNNPMYQYGELTTLVIPLASTSVVDTVTLRWADTSIPSIGPVPGRGTSTWRLGRATEFSVCTRTPGLDGFVTNCVSVTSTGRVDVVPVGALTDQLVLHLERRPLSVDFISLQEIEVVGGQISLATATAPGGGESQLTSPDARYSILSAVDGSSGTAWASGPEAQVEILLPLAANTTVGEIQLNWNCRTVPSVGTLGPAASFLVRARDRESGQLVEVPFLAQPRTASGDQRLRFGTEQGAISIITDRVVVVLTARESGVNFYSLREIGLRNGAASIPLRLPTASSALAWSGVNSSFLAVFDKHNGTRWACRTQGMVGAMEIRGNNMKLTHLRVIGFGTKAVREAFPVGISTPPTSGAATAHLGNVLVEDCVITEPATNNTDGLTAFSIISIQPHTLTNAVVRRCAVKGVRQHFVYSHAYHVLHVENSLAEDVDHGVYFEPDGRVVGPVLVRSNQFVNVRRGVYLLMHPGTRFDSITCVNNEIVLVQGSGWGFVACDTCAPGPSATITNATVLNNVIRYADWLPRPHLLEGGLFYSNIRHGVFGNNVVALGTANGLRLRDCPSGFIPAVVPPEECPPEGGGVPLAPAAATYPPCLDPPLPEYRRAWFNNRDATGTLLPARFRGDGVDGLASDPQWP